MVAKRKKVVTLKQLVGKLKKSDFVKIIFDTPKRKRFLNPFFGFILPMMMAMFGELTEEEAFDFIFSDKFKKMLVTALVQVKRREAAKREVARLFKDMKLELPPDLTEDSK